MAVHFDRGIERAAKKKLCALLFTPDDTNFFCAGSDENND
jgi:hypothetical protein